MPLDTVFNLLRDSMDNIRLEVAVGGDVAAPEFDLSQVINRALGKAVQMAAMSYVKSARRCS